MEKTNCIHDIFFIDRKNQQIVYVHIIDSFCRMSRMRSKGFVLFPNPHSHARAQVSSCASFVYSEIQIKFFRLLLNTRRDSLNIDIIKKNRYLSLYNFYLLRNKTENDDIKKNDQITGVVLMIFKKFSI
jgi:hypothetical protein